MKDTLTLKNLAVEPGQGALLHVVDPQTDIGRHDHVFHEIAYIRSGSAEHVTAAGIEHLRAGDVIVIRPQVWHGYQHCRNVAVYNCLIDPKILHQLMGLLQNAHSCSVAIPEAVELFRRRPPIPANAVPVKLHVPTEERPQWHLLFDTILREQANRSVGWTAAIMAAMLQIMILTVRSYTTRPSRVNLSAIAEIGVLQAAHYLEEHYRQPIMLEELARKVGLSPAYLSRCFTQRMGMGVVDYIHRLRSEEACRLLRLTKAPITDISTQLGYTDMAYFSRCFHRHVGVSARGYRAMGR